MTASSEFDHILSDSSSRILVLSSRISQAKLCIDRIQNGSKLSSLSSVITTDANTSSNSFESSEGLIKIPWTITNKYYSAPVHFAAHRMHGFSPHQFENIPAVIFVWSQGESYKHHIERIAQDLSGYGPEVCLAVRLAPQMSSRPTSPISHDEEHDDIETDGFLSSRGFEFIDASEKNTSRIVEGKSFENEAWSSEIPGIERVLDALSTIMWPSMKTTSKVDKWSPQTRERERVLLDWANTSQYNNLKAAGEMTASSAEQMSVRTQAMKQEMEELAQWLEEDHALRDDPWKSAVSTDGMSTAQIAMEPDEKLFGATKEKFGFDDDFTVFVSAPALDTTEISGRSTPDVFTDALSPNSLHAGSLYKSLGSVSDFGGSEDGKDADEDELPSQEEILAASSRIFGTSKFPLPPAVTASSMSSVMEAPNVFLDDNLDAFAENPGTDSDGGSYDMEPFDLSKVLGALQEMKAEIANMEDEGDRRRAAARVALGLVYGLEADT